MSRRRGKTRYVTVIAALDVNECLAFGPAAGSAWLNEAQIWMQRNRPQPVNSEQFGNAATLGTYIHTYILDMVVRLLCLPVEWAKIKMKWGSYYYYYYY
jgi:hypothetical protein